MDVEVEVEVISNILLTYWEDKDLYDSVPSDLWSFRMNKPDRLVILLLLLGIIEIQVHVVSAAY